MRVCLLIAVVTAYLLPASASSQATLPTITEEIISKQRQFYAAITPRSLLGSVLNIYQVQDKENVFNFIPYVQVDWSLLKQQHQQACPANKSADEIASIKPRLFLYDTALIDEIKRLLSDKTQAPIQRISVTLPPNIGLVAFAYNAADEPFEVVTTIPYERILRGAPLTDLTAGIPSFLEGQIRGTCKEILDILERRKLVALMFVVGSKVKVNQFTAGATLLRKSNLLSDLRNNESKIDKTTVSSKRSGGTVGIKLSGVFGAKGGSEKGSATSERQLQRIISRTWLDNSFNRAATSVNVSQVCETSDCSSTIMDTLFKQFFGDLQAHRVIIEDQSKDIWKARYQGVEIPVNKITMNDELKTAFKEAAKLSEKSSGEYNGIKFTKEADGQLTTDSDITWRRQGEDWIPTTLDAYVTSFADLEQKLDVQYRQMIVGESANAAISLPVIQVPQVKPFSPTLTLRQEIGQVLSNPQLSSRMANRKPANYDLSQREPELLYKNEREYPIDLLIRIESGPAGCQGELYVNETLVGAVSRLLERPGLPDCYLDAIIPAGTTYKVNLPLGALKGWTEWF